jgi:hypothetical protein
VEEQDYDLAESLGKMASIVADHVRSARAPFGRAVVMELYHTTVAEWAQSY